MKKHTKQFLFWTPRIMCLVFALFTSIFAFDVFNEGISFWEVLFALMVHLIPTFVLLIVLVISWKHELVGTVTFLLLTIFYLIMTWGKFPLLNYIILCSPMVVISILFFLNWKYKEEIEAR